MTFIRRLMILSLVLAAVSALGGGPARPAAGAPAFQIDQESLRVVELTNQQRASQGLAPVAVNDLLVAAAAGHSADMATNNFMSHTGSDGSTPGDRITRAGYVWRTYGENVAAGYSNAQAVMDGWMNSSGHRANILNPAFTEIGVAVRENPNATYRWYWTMVLAAPLSSNPTPTPTSGSPTPPTPTSGSPTPPTPTSGSPTPTIAPPTATATPTNTAPTATPTSVPTATPTTIPPTTPPTATPVKPNLALNKAASGSTACNSNEGPPKAVNGSVSGGTSDKFCSLAGTKWLQVDLGASLSVGRFVVRHAGAGGESTGYNTRAFSIQVSNNGSTWTTVATVTANTASVTTHPIAPATARYVRLTIATPTNNGNGAARIYEFEVYAP